MKFQAFVPLFHSSIAFAQTPKYISPKAAATGNGNISNTIPFRQSSVHYQQVHSSNSWTSQKIGPITRLRFRAKATTSGGTLDLDIYMAQSPNNAANASATFANNVIASTETLVFSSKSYKLPNVPAGTWGAGDFALSKPFVFIAGKHMSIRMVIRSNTSTSYTLDAFSDWRFGPRQNNGCKHPQASRAATHSVTYRSPGNIWDFNGWSWLPKAIPALLTIGVSNTQWGPIKLPLDLKPFGAPGCIVHNDWTLVVPGVTRAISSGFIGIKAPTPADPKLIGLTTHTQYAFLDAGANALGLFTSEGNSQVNIPAPNGVSRIFAIGTPAATRGTLGIEFAVPVALN